MQSPPFRPEVDAIPELRRLLLGNRRIEVLDELAQGVSEQDAESISKALPDAVRIRAKKDSDLADALSTTIEQGLTTSIERNPKPIADAIFPVIFPAIRRAIEHAMDSSMQAINHALNYGVSPKAFKWRIEGWRSGLSFGEVVLKHTLRYRVEQVLLVHRKTGLLLEHVVAPEVEATDADLVSAMLTAIGQFVQDSFKVNEDDGLGTIQIGELNVVLEPGPHAIVAAVVRGQLPESYRDVLLDAVESVHRRFAAPLVRFDGDTAAFVEASPLLEHCLESEYREDASKSSPFLWIILVIVIAGLGWWVFNSVRTSQRDNAYIQALGETPGIEVIKSFRDDGRLNVVGLRDPLSADPSTLLAGANLQGSDVSAQWSPFISVEGGIVARRASDALRAPETVSFRADDSGRLIGEGIAPPSWIVEARKNAAFVAGVTQADLTQIKTPLQVSAEQIQSLSLRFGGSGVGLDAGQDAAMNALVEELRILAAAAAEEDGTVVLEIVGHTDDLGGAAENLALSRARADAVRGLLPPEVSYPENLVIRTVGAGASERLAEGENPPSRRVTFRVLLPESASGS